MVTDLMAGYLAYSDPSDIAAEAHTGSAQDHQKYANRPPLTITFVPTWSLSFVAEGQ